MGLALVTGSAGLIGSEAVRLFADKGLDVIGVDNDMRQTFFGASASTAANRRRLEADIGRYSHVDADIRDTAAMERLFAGHGNAIVAVVHTAAQPSHDWAASDPTTDFTINANGTLVLLEAARRHCPNAPFLFTSTNKIYGDAPNRLPLIEGETRWEVAAGHAYAEHGINESMSIDGTMHSLFGVSKAAADLMVQEYGRYFGMKTACFRGGCLTGPAHAGAELHGFLAYLVKCAATNSPYTVFGYKGKQVRDNIHAFDFVNALWHFFENPREAEVYNMGGSRHSHCSMVEAIAMCERLTGRPMKWSYDKTNRAGDHMWWVSDVRKFQDHYPAWRYRYNLKTMLAEIQTAVVDSAG
jgi:CDP-paratose 2-epimerase